MSTWLIFPLIPALFYAVMNHTDKYLVEKVVKNRGIGSLLIFSSLAGLVPAVIILVFKPSVLYLEPRMAMTTSVLGFMYIAYVLPYLYALEKYETSFVVPLTQLSSGLTALLSYFVLGESLTTTQILGCGVILLGSVILTTEFKKLKISGFKSRLIVLMGICDILLAVSGVYFKKFALEQSFWQVTFWQSIGMAGAGILLFFVTSYRRQFLEVIKRNRKQAISINVFNESIGLAGLTTSNFAILMAPIGLVYFVENGFQPIFVFLIGVAITLYFPKIAKERINKGVVIHKLISILIILAGTYLLSSPTF